MKTSRRFKAMLLVLLAFVPHPIHAALETYQLRCEYLRNPLAVQHPQPRLSWKLRSSEREEYQKAYQIRAASSPSLLDAGNADFWDTGRIISDQTLHLQYAGSPLGSRQRVHWQVRVWDQADRPSAWSQPAFWQMGILNSTEWQARWISVTNIPSLASEPNFGFHSQLSKTSETNQWITIDLEQPCRLDGVRLFPAYPHPWRQDTADFLFPRRFRLLLSDDEDFENPTEAVARLGEDVPLPNSQPLQIHFEPATARYARLVVTNLPLHGGYYHGFALAEMQVLDGGNNLALNKPAAASASFENGTWSQKNLTDGVLINRRGAPEELLPAPLFQKSFQITQPVRRAVAYASALGLYELRMNGRRVGDHRLAPEWTDYHTRVFYQAYDVTKQLRKGENVIGGILGEGWFSGRIGMSDWIDHKFSRVYGDKPWFLAQLEIEYADGRREVIATDETWQVTLDGPIRSSDLLEGETYDARRELSGWDEPGFENTTGGSNSESEPQRAWHSVEVNRDFTAGLVAQPNEPIRTIQTLKPVSLNEPKPGVHIFDLGQNMVGCCRLKMRVPAGAEVTLRHAEALNEDGTVYLANLRGAPQVDRYISKGRGLEVFEPRFTFHGFRYVEVTGLVKPPKLTDLKGMVFCSSAPEVSHFECSSPLLNRLWQNILWTQRGNLVSVPTDCPQRDERLGWMGDIQAFSQTAIFNMDMAAFFAKWMLDVRDAQARDGRFPDFAPHPFNSNEKFSGAPAWGDAGVIVPWKAFVNYGDRRLLEEHFESACHWVDYIAAHNPNRLWQTNRGNCYNDWLNGNTIKQGGWPETGASVPKDIFATAFFAHSTELVSRMAQVLHQDKLADHYAELAHKIRLAFNQAFVESDGSLTNETQAGYALALHFDLLPHSLRNPAARRLVDNIAHYQGHLSTGIQTTHRLMLELPRYGYPDVAWQLLTNRTFPSWGFSIDNGATTIWERWDGYVPGRGFQDRGMNSFNHWALGSVGEWMARYILGIHPDENHPGYQHFSIRPHPGGGVTWAKGHYDSIRGRIACDWRLDTRFHCHVTVPPNTTASVYLPAVDATRVFERGKPVLEIPAARYVSMENGSAVVRIGSGTYHFTSEVRP